MKRVPLIILFAAIAFVVVGRLHLGFIRAFDPDEFAHIHWAFLTFRGQLPYRDFFFYIIPLFQWILAPVFLLPFSPATLTVFRLYILGFFLAVMLLTYVLARKITRSDVAAVASVLLFSVFPMTFDKTIDVRPDIVMVLFYFLAVLPLLDAGTVTRKRAFASGILLGLSFLAMFKILFVFPAILYLVLTLPKKSRMGSLVWGSLGCALPFILVFAYFAASGISPQAYKAFAHDQFAVNYGKQAFSLIRTLSPWPLVYVGAAGPSLPWTFNIAVWIGGVLGTLILLIRRPRPGMFMLIFETLSILLLYIFPVPYVQYFMPVSVMACIGAAYAVVFVITRLGEILHVKSVSLPIAVLAIAVPSLLSFRLQYTDRLATKQGNDEQMQVIANVLSVIPENEPVYDMTGSYVFRPDGYYFCCHPYAEFVDRLDPKPPGLKESLIASKTKYLVLDQKGYVFWLPKPDDLEFMLTHYLVSDFFKIYTPGVMFSCEGGDCYRMNLHKRIHSDKKSKSFDLPFALKYTLRTEPPGQTISVNGITLTDGVTVPLSATIYEAKVPVTLKQFSLQMAIPQ